MRISMKVVRLILAVLHNVLFFVNDAGPLVSCSGSALILIVRLSLRFAQAPPQAWLSFVNECSFVCIKCTDAHLSVTSRTPTAITW